MGRKACENLSGVEMKLFVKFEGDACRSGSVVPGHTTYRQTDDLYTGAGGGVGVEDVVLPS